MPADPQKAKVCPAGDPYCPCQDGDACHYVDLPGSPAMQPTMSKPQTARWRRFIRAAWAFIKFAPIVFFIGPEATERLFVNDKQ